MEPRSRSEAPSLQTTERATPTMVDWAAGSYETTAAELEPVAKAVVQQAAPSPGDVVLDLACGTGTRPCSPPRGGLRW